MHFIWTIPSGLLFGGEEKCNDPAPQHRSPVFSGGGCKITTFRLAVRSNRTHWFSPNVAAYIISEATQGSEHKPTHAHAPLKGFKAFQMSRGYISLPENKLLILFQLDECLNQMKKNTDTHVVHRSPSGVHYAIFECPLLILGFLYLQCLWISCNYLCVFISFYTGGIWNMLK